MIRENPIVRRLIDEGAAMIVQYGSSIESPDTATDVDLVAIYDDVYNRNHFRLKELDVTRLGADELESHISVLDPVYATEPFLTGEVIHGSEAEATAIRERISRASPSDDAIHHNLQEAVSAFERCTEHCRLGQIPTGLQSLSFAISHWAAAAWYAAGRSPDTVPSMLDDDLRDLYEDVRTDAKTAATDDSISVERVRSHQARCTRLFL